MPTIGYDHADGINPPPPSALQAHGATFMVRYLSGDAGQPTPFWTKVIRAQEVRDLSAAGIHVVLNFERDGHFDMAGGYAAGQRWGASSLGYQRSIGQPAGIPTYCSVDWDATLGGDAVSGEAVGNMRQIAAFLDGWQHEQGGWGTVGVYGSFYVCKWLFANTQLQYAWQCFAWSYGNWHPRAQLRQVSCNQYIHGTNCDGNEAWSSNFGGYLWGAPPPPPPPNNRYATEPIIREGANDRTQYPIGVHPVKDLQHGLASAFYPALAVDGLFGPGTARAVRAFQANELGGKLVVDGVVGPMTWRKLDAILDWQHR